MTRLTDSETEWLEQLADWHGAEAMKHPEGKTTEPHWHHRTAARLIRAALDAQIEPPSEGSGQ